MREEAAKQDLGGRVPPSPFRDAFGRARLETLGAGTHALREESPARPRFEYRIEKRTGRRRRDAAAWNALGREGWELVSVTSRHAHFRRTVTATA